MMPTPSSPPDPAPDRVGPALEQLFDFSAGTVWGVREDLWQERFKNEGVKYDTRSTRVWHPGVSLRLTPPHSLLEYVPMLHGTSGDTGPVVARGLSKEAGDQHPTSFGRCLAPVKVDVKTIVSRDPVADPDAVEGTFFDRFLVVANLHKPRLSPEEQKNLRAWMEQKGLA